MIELTLKEELIIHGLSFGEFNAPDFDPTPRGLDALLESLFRVTPPTALIVSSPSWTTGVLAFLNRSGLKVPEDVSLISGYTDNTLAWHRPAIAHFTCDYHWDRVLTSYFKLRYSYFPWVFRHSSFVIRLDCQNSLPKRRGLGEV